MNLNLFQIFDLLKNRTSLGLHSVHIRKRNIANAKFKIQNKNKIKKRIKDYYVEDLLYFALTFMSIISENRLISMKII